MKLSTRARYALRMMVELAKMTDGNSTVTLGQLARATSVSRRYLEQLAIALKSAGLITGISGKGGGYLLARSAEAIRVQEIVEAAIGPVNIVECVDNPEQCIRSDACECRWIYKRINTRINEVLSDFSLSDLVARNRANEEALESDQAGCPARGTIVQ
jgi:Rrf2 family protein